VVVELDGADKFKNVFPLLGPDGFGPTLFGLVDKKESGACVNAFPGKQKAIVDHKVFISNEDLEDEYARALGGPETTKALITGRFRSEKAILQSTGCNSVAEITPEAAAQLCRGKGKVEAATCIAEALTETTAGKIGSVARLVWKLNELSQQ
jgi:hypothetical protein